MAQQHQYSLALIQHEVNNSIIEQRSNDGYINATALCAVADKRWHNYVRNETTGHFLRALEAKTRIRVTELIQEVRSSSGTASTWVHPKVAIHLAQWLSAEFAVQVSEWVYEWMSGRGGPATRALPYHIQRHMMNQSGVPAGYFSILQEMTFMLIAPLEQAGYELPERMVPDISMGKFLCKHLRDQLGVDTDALPVYIHRYPDGRNVEAKLYPNEYLAEFRRIIQSEWLPKRSAAYFKERDPVSLPYLDRVILALPGPVSAANAPKFHLRKKKGSK
ncbi:KilA-N domain-containing protein [Pseudothauera nasutitermitis]|uniref:KilA-N domain-containing protein n=1 Tax=Pseudothauera nasutitermitis TaxID=2565930 RepID=A0A4S4AQ61_9RHOO|nr:KilA-N domain-containing protein [Pseudothauera nasutitermitis]THF61392.1 KilA-N domain-containing protein [Pseudothauera nasutitermitis]